MTQKEERPRTQNISCWAIDDNPMSLYEGESLVAILLSQEKSTKLAGATPIRMTNKWSLTGDPVTEQEKRGLLSFYNTRCNRD